MQHETIDTSSTTGCLQDAPVADAKPDDIKDLLGGALFKALFKWMEESGPIYLLPTGPVSSFLVISDPDAAKHVLQRSDNPKNNVYGKGLVAEVSEFLFGVGFATSGLPLLRSLTTSSELTAHCPPQLGMRNCERAYLHALPCGTSRFRPCPLDSASHVDHTKPRSTCIHYSHSGIITYRHCITAPNFAARLSGMLPALHDPQWTAGNSHVPSAGTLQNTCDAGDQQQKRLYFRDAPAPICSTPPTQLACLVQHSNLVSGCSNRGVAQRLPGHEYHCICSAKRANMPLHHVIGCAEHPATHVWIK